MATECANPLLLDWLKEWWDQARERNSKGATMYAAAAFDLLMLTITAIRKHFNR